MAYRPRSDTKRWADGDMHLYQLMTSEIMPTEYPDESWANYCYWNWSWGDSFSPDEPDVATDNVMTKPSEIAARRR